MMMMIMMVVVLVLVMVMTMTTMIVTMTHYHQPAGLYYYWQVRAALVANPAADFTLEPDGTFWITFDDFCRVFNKVYICRVFGPKFKQFKVHGEWRGKTAAGSHKEMEDRDGEGEEASAESHKGWLRCPNGDPGWFNNPQCVTQCSRLFCVVVVFRTGRLCGWWVCVGVFLWGL